MKKIILLILLLGLFVLILLSNSHHTDTSTSNRLKSESIPENINTANSQLTAPAKGVLHHDLAGHWTLFLHYPDYTQGIDLEIDIHGKIISFSSDLLKDARLQIMEDGTICIHNGTLRLPGIPEPDYSYFKGMATIKGRKNPVPFSACKISETLNNN